MKAAEASLAARNGLRLELPAGGEGVATFTLPGGFAAQVRERGLAGPGVAAGAAIAYRRAEGASYWSAGPGGYEEWLLVERAGEGPVAQWEVQGAALRQAGEAVELLDGAGAARVRVTAPRTFDAVGRPARSWLRVEGDVIALLTEARGLALVDPAWATMGTMVTARDLHTATLLSTGQVLVAGGGTAAAELYDPTTGGWSSTGSLSSARSYHTAVRLRSGQVLVAGGYDGTNILAGAELYDPATRTWTATGALATARVGQTATLLPSGLVMVAGGSVSVFPPSTTATAELYDPAAGTWSATGSLATPRSMAAAALLPSGKVIVTGGMGDTAYLASAELYDPVGGTWRATGAMGAARASHGATWLGSGKLLVAGGSAGTTILASAELYDAALETWSATGALATARASHGTTLLPSGQVLVTGGQGAGIVTLSSAELYDPALGTWSAGPALSGPRRFHTATLLASGRVLVAAGRGATGALATAEECEPALGTWSATGALATARNSHTATLLPSGKVLVVGGVQSSTNTHLASGELYDPAGGTWSATGSMGAARAIHTATLLFSGKVLVAGGQGNGALLANAELYDPATGGWSATGPLGTARAGHTATLLPSGKVLVASGRGAAGAELYDPATATWSATGSLATARVGHTATLLPSGKVLVAGGEDSAYTQLASAELYDPVTGVWTAAGSFSGGRTGHTATLLPSGQLILLGVSTFANFDSQGYDTATGIWNTGMSPIWFPRSFHAAALLPSGKLLAAGGYEKAGPASGPVAATMEFGETTGSPTTSPLGTARMNQTATRLPSGRLLVVGGLGASVTDLASAELYDEGRGATGAPTVTSAPTAAVAGTAIDLTGPLFTGLSEGSGGGHQSSPANQPLLLLLRQENEATALAPVSTFSAGSLRATLPASLQPGWHWLRVVVNGATSTARSILVVRPLVVSPAAPSAPPRGSISFSASDGSGVGQAWSLETNGSGATIDAATGAYTAGATGGATDVVRVADSVGTIATASVSVGAGVAISPATASTPPRGTATFTASGGSGAGYAWSLATNGSGGSIGAATGAYTAGTTGGVTDVVQAADSLGNVATAAVTVGAGLAISPATASTPPRGTAAFTASGGSGAGYAWSLATNGSGGSIDAATGAYAAGTTGGVTDVVQAADSLGNVATVRVVVGAGLAISPAAPTTPPHGTITFGATGGSGAGYEWYLASTASAGSITVAGLYTAGSVGGTDVVLARDSLGNEATTDVTVTAQVTVSPASATVAPGGQVRLTASGGTGAGFVWTFFSNASGGTVDATGLYTAGATGGVIDDLEVNDPLGNGAGVRVTVTSAPPPPPPAPGKSGGCGCNATGDASLLALLSLLAFRPGRRRRGGP